MKRLETFSFWWFSPEKNMCFCGNVSKAMLLGDEHQWIPAIFLASLKYPGLDSLRPVLVVRRCLPGRHKFLPGTWENDNELVDLYIVSYSCWAADRLFSHKPVEKLVGKPRSPNPKHQFAIALRVDYHFDQQKMRVSRVSQGLSNPLGFFTWMNWHKLETSLITYLGDFFCGKLGPLFWSTPVLQLSSAAALISDGQLPE